MYHETVYSNVCIYHSILYYLSHNSRKTSLLWTLSVTASAEEVEFRVSCVIFNYKKVEVLLLVNTVRLREIKNIEAM